MTSSLHQDTQKLSPSVHTLSQSVSQSGPHPSRQARTNGEEKDALGPQEEGREETREDTKEEPKQAKPFHALMISSEQASTTDALFLLSLFDSEALQAGPMDGCKC
mmetsp:Transcript_40186/g.79216  ORF Transcript_40186/g.79216 Transcript_40186/m.79216 type:complete len:106 (-) Transcript_40186:1226-1543(-)